MHRWQLEGSCLRGFQAGFSWIRNLNICYGAVGAESHLAALLAIGFEEGHFADLHIEQGRSLKAVGVDALEAERLAVGAYIDITSCARAADECLEAAGADKRYLVASVTHRHHSGLGAECVSDISTGIAVVIVDLRSCAETAQQQAQTCCHYS